MQIDRDDAIHSYARRCMAWRMAGRPGSRMAGAWRRRYCTATRATYCTGTWYAGHKTERERRAGCKVCRFGRSIARLDCMSMTQLPTKPRAPVDLVVLVCEGRTCTVPHAEQDLDLSAQGLFASATTGLKAATRGRDFGRRKKNTLRRR